MNKLLDVPELRSAIVFDNGINLSIQRSEFHYCSLKNKKENELSKDIPLDFEIYAWKIDENGKEISIFKGDKRADVSGAIGWQTPEEVLEIIFKLSEKKG
tara:strand:- start:2963 stop:3262 length:300 start_codon:yes stop_codon:yes gene_type:complete